MIESTDLEICKRIAEIEGLQHQIEMYDSPHAYIYSEELSKEYNPLTDDALCFQLMVKYDVELTPLFSGCWCATVAKKHTFDEQVDYKLCPSWLDDNPNKAICLAIVAANEVER